jgi:integrase
MCPEMPHLNLTDLTIQNLPSGIRMDYWDRRMSRFGIRVGAKSKTFIVKVKNTRIAIGRYPNLSLSKARRKAHVLLGSFVEQGTIPFDEAREDFIREHCAKKNKPSTALETERLLKRFTFSGSIGLVTKRDILNQLRKLPPAEANHAFTAIRTFLNWCVANDYLAYTPLHKVKLPNRVPSRTRLLTDTEVAAIWRQSLVSGDFGMVIRGLILSAQRLSQITHFDRCWIRNDRIVFPGAIMKSNREHIIPLLPELRDNLPMVTVPIIVRAKLMQDFRDAVAIPHWTLHDLRRYFSTTMSKLRVPIDVTESILDHTTGSRSEVQRIYDHDDRLPQMLEALESYHRHLFEDVLKADVPLSSAAAA